MHLLAIETSCDETAAAVLRADGGRGPGRCPGVHVRREGSSLDATVLSDVVLSQDEIHAPYGGVVPELASRRHIQSIGYVVQESLTGAGLRLEDVDHYAVTQGPGLIGSLLVGLSFAKGLAYYHQKPLLGIDHVQAHIEAAFLEHKDVALPALALIVSGGHTSLYFLKKRLSFELLGRTRDDAAGEALDKIAKFLELGYPGGPVIQKLAEHGDPARFGFALPRMSDRSLDFSFSGLKTAALRIIRENRLTKSDPRLPDFLASFENAVVRALLDNLFRAASRRDPSSVIICGGVARNKRLRTEFERRARQAGLAAAIPSPRLCTDNAAMIGALALTRIEYDSKKRTKRGFSLDLDAYPRMPA